MLQLAVGLWRVWSSVARFVAADPPSSLRVRALNPSRGAPVVAGGAFLDMCVELFYASPLRAVLTGGGGVDDHHFFFFFFFEKPGFLLLHIKVLVVTAQILQEHP